MIILDTNVVSELMKPVPSASVAAWIAKQPQAELFTTTITEAEVFAGIESLPPGKRRDQLRASADDMFQQDFSGRVLLFDSSAARAFAVIAGHRRRSGRPLSHADGQIAAIAQLGRALVATRDTADFEGCGVDVINPWNA